MEPLLSILEKHIGRQVLVPDKITTALTHRSFKHETEDSQAKDNERLEFLGDAVLGLIITQAIMKRFPQKKEGVLSKFRSSLVCEPILHQVAKDLDLGSFVLLGKGEERNKGRKKSSIMSDALEALIAAVYLSNGLEDTRALVLSLFAKHLGNVEEHAIALDCKSQLQEWTLKNKKVTPKYVVVNQEGPDHNKQFETEVLVQNQVLGQGKGKSKKDAEQKAAKQALLTLGVEQGGVS